MAVREEIQSQYLLKTLLTNFQSNVRWQISTAHIFHRKISPTYSSTAEYWGLETLGTDLCSLEMIPGDPPDPTCKAYASLVKHCSVPMVNFAKMGPINILFFVLLNECWYSGSQPDLRKDPKKGESETDGSTVFLYPCFLCGLHLRYFWFLLCWWYYIVTNRSL